MRFAAEQNDCQTDHRGGSHQNVQREFPLIIAQTEYRSEIKIQRRNENNDKDIRNPEQFHFHGANYKREIIIQINNHANSDERK